MAILTTARQAVWDAIDNWPSLSGQFRQKIRYEPNAGTKLGPRDTEEPSGQDFPCIGIAPSVVNPVWLGNQVQFHPLSLTIQIWTSGWDSLLKNEELWEGVIDAIYKCKPEGIDDTYVGIATAHGPFGFGNSRWTKVTFQNGQRAWSHSFEVVLQIIKSLVV